MKTDPMDTKSVTNAVCKIGNFLAGGIVKYLMKVLKLKHSKLIIFLQDDFK
jgi:hypothetical protein